MTVNFIDVGRDKRSWSATIKGNDILGEIASAVRKSGAIMSRSLDIELDEDGVGEIIIGGFRTVGMFKIPDYASQN